jgi:hypothetical protein
LALCREQRLAYARWAVDRQYAAFAADGERLVISAQVFGKRLRWISADLVPRELSERLRSSGKRIPGYAAAFHLPMLPHPREVSVVRTTLKPPCAITAPSRRRRWAIQDSNLGPLPYQRTPARWTACPRSAVIRNPPQVGDFSAVARGPYFDR